MRGGAADFMAHFTCVRAEQSSPVLFEIMVKEAPFWIMLGLILVKKWARLAFEFGQIQENKNIFTTFLLPREIRWIVRYGQVLAIRPVGLLPSSSRMRLPLMPPLRIALIPRIPMMHPRRIDLRNLIRIGSELYLLNVILKVLSVDLILCIAETSSQILNRPHFLIDFFSLLDSWGTSEFLRISKCRYRFILEVAGGGAGV